MDTFQKKLRYWSFYRQGLDRSQTDLLQALQNVIAVYSTHPSGPLSLRARVKTFEVADFEALDTQKKAIRIPAMRLSVHQIPQETARYLFAAAVPSKTSDFWQKRYWQRGVTNDDFLVWRKELLALTHYPQTAKELKQQITFPDEMLKFALNRMAFEGDLLRIGAKNLRANIISYVKTTAWIEAWGENYFLEISQEEALLWLAKEYFRVFAPARIQDFQWWVGITTAQAKDIVARLDMVSLTDDYYILLADFDAFEQFDFSRKLPITILPQWDSYLMGYAPNGRRRLVTIENQAKVYGKIGATGGNAPGTIMIQGKVEGIWKHKFKGKVVQFEITLFSKLSTTIIQKIEAELQAIGQLLSAKDVVIHMI